VRSRNPRAKVAGLLGEKNGGNETKLAVASLPIVCTAVEALSKGKPIADSLSASGLVLCDFYTHSSTCFKIAATGKGKFEVYDTLGNKLAALSAKFGADGLGTISFTTADKVSKYTLTVFDCGNGALTGSVTLAEKSNGTTYTYVGLVDIY